MLRIGREIESCNLLFMEEAVDAFDCEGYRRLATALTTPQAAGERISTLRAFRCLLETRSISYLQPDPTLCGGLAEVVKICALAESFGVEVALHNCGSPISTAACLHLDSCIPNACIQEIFPYRPDIFYELVDYAPEKDIRNSYWFPNNRPGLGLDLQHKRIEPFLLFTCQ
jgi:galactonate dehydratase